MIPLEPIKEEKDDKIQDKSDGSIDIKAIEAMLNDFQ